MVTAGFWLQRLNGILIQFHSVCEAKNRLMPHWHPSKGSAEVRSGRNINSLFLYRCVVNIQACCRHGNNKERTGQATAGGIIYYLQSLFIRISHHDYKFVRTMNMSEFPTNILHLIYKSSKIKAACWFTSGSNNNSRKCAGELHVWRWTTGVLPLKTQDSNLHTN